MFHIYILCKCRSVCISKIFVLIKKIILNTYCGIYVGVVFSYIEMHIRCGAYESDFYFSATFSREKTAKPHTCNLRTFVLYLCICSEIDSINVEENRQNINIACKLFHAAHCDIRVFHLRLHEFLMSRCRAEETYMYV